MPQTADKGICLILFASFVCILADTKGFAPAGATKGLSDRPLETFGADVRNLLQITDFLGGQGKVSLFAFLLRRVSPLRRRPKGFPIALWKPSAPLQQVEICI